MVIDGRAIADRIFTALQKEKLPRKTLAAILVGNNPVSISFIRQKEKAANRLGVNFQMFRFSSQLTQSALEANVRGVARRREIGGIILQLPLPPRFNRDSVIHCIPPRKDVDALTGSLFVSPPAVGALAVILKHIRFNPRGKQAVVIGRGLLVGIPIAKWLKGRAQSTHVFHRELFNKNLLRSADLVVSGVGEPGLIRGDMIKNGAVVIDFGFSIKRGKISGDADVASCAKRARTITPTPGGTGPVLVAELFRNFYTLLTTGTKNA